MRLTIYTLALITCSALGIGLLFAAFAPGIPWPFLWLVLGLVALGFVPFALWHYRTEILRELVAESVEVTDE